MAVEPVGDESHGYSTDGDGDKKGADGSKRKRPGVISRLWNWLFRGDDFEKRLQYISKEEASVMARVNRRSQRWQRMGRHLIIFSVILEVIAVSYAVLTTRSSDLTWQMRAFRVLPMFLLPCLSSATYYALSSLIKMCDSKDEKTLEKLRFERREKIDELKEKTKYYTTQQLIQRYDTDPAAKAAAAAVLASKLGEDSGLKVYLGDDPNLNAWQGRSKDAEALESSGLRRRKPMKSGGSNSWSGGWPDPTEEMPTREAAGVSEPSEKGQPLVVEHYQPKGDVTHDGGWIARIAAMLVGENPMQSYALICGNCRRHNGLVSKEDFLYTTYYCPHCNALNMSKAVKDQSLSSSHGAATSQNDETAYGMGSSALEKPASIAAAKTASDMTLANDMGWTVD